MPKQRGRLGSLLGPTAEELAKKDDDRKLPPPGTTAWAPVRIVSRRSARRLAQLLVFFAIVYATYSLLRPTPEFRDYVPNFPTYENPNPAHFDRVWPPSRSRPQKIGSELAGLDSAPSRDGKTSLSLPALPSTLKEVEATSGHGKERNKNVLFASSSPKSAAALLPLACEMGRQGRSHVHYAVMSRNDQSIRELKNLNGIDETCNISFHGRNCFTNNCLHVNVVNNLGFRCSSGLCVRVDRRASTGSHRASIMYVCLLPLQLGLQINRSVDYLNSYMHPQAIIVDGSVSEDPSFLAAIRSEADHDKQSVIELPENGADQFGWLAKLDSSSLSGIWRPCLHALIMPLTTLKPGIRLISKLSSTRRRQDPEA